MTEPYSVNVLLNHPHIVMSDVHLAAGAETPRHAHKHDYVVRPRQDSTLVKKTFKAGQLVSTETIEHKANVPYYVAKSEDGTEFTIANVGSAAMLCEKTQLPPRA